MVLLWTGGARSEIRLAHLERPVFGGFRTYFCCPGCDRLCDLLYACPNIACRRCHNLAWNHSRLNPIAIATKVPA